MRKDPIERLRSKLSDDGRGCLNWTGATNHRGYGRIKIGRRLHQAHRVAYEAERGPIPDGLVIDHLCRNRRCCNPAHMEAVTSAENTRRGLSGEKDAAKTHCPRGHPYDGENTARTPLGSRYCRICKREQTTRNSRVRRARIKAQSLSAGGDHERV